MGVACGAGASDHRCAEGPQALREEGLIFRLRRSGLDAAWSATIQPPPGCDPLAAVTLVAESLAKRTHDLAVHGRLPVVLGGDHSCAIGTWKGIARALAPRGPLGLIWIDAHMDAHTPATTPSGMLHGMPLACLLGYGDQRLTAIAAGTQLDPRHICLVGVRSFECGEAALLRRLGVRVFGMKEVTRRGLSTVMDEALAIARGSAGGYGVSLDLDALDPRDAPGVGSAVPRGIRAAGLRHALARLGHDPAFAAMEIVEYNPRRDCNGVTARVVADMVESLLAPAPPCRANRLRFDCARRARGRRELSGDSSSARIRADKAAPGVRFVRR